jgi:hypothetical protein
MGGKDSAIKKTELLENNIVGGCYLSGLNNVLSGSNQ